MSISDMMGGGGGGGGGVDAGSGDVGTCGEVVGVGMDMGMGMGMCMLGRCKFLSFGMLVISMV